MNNSQQILWMRSFPATANHQNPLATYGAPGYNFVLCHYLSNLIQDLKRIGKGQ